MLVVHLFFGVEMNHAGGGEIPVKGRDRSFDQFHPIDLVRIDDIGVCISVSLIQGDSVHIDGHVGTMGALGESPASEKRRLCPLVYTD